MCIRDRHDLISDFDLVVGAVPGFMGYKMMKDVIEAKKNIVDISFYLEDPFGLDELAKKNNVIAVMDCGVAPGMGNIIFGHHNESMEISDYECLVGGLPVKREWPYEYQAVFSPIDVIEEYIRPARYVQNKKIIVREALSDTELVELQSNEAHVLESLGVCNQSLAAEKQRRDNFKDALDDIVNKIESVPSGIVDIVGIKKKLSDKRIRASALRAENVNLSKDCAHKESVRIRMDSFIKEFDVDTYLSLIHI